MSPIEFAYPTGRGVTYVAATFGLAALGLVALIALVVWLVT